MSNIHDLIEFQKKLQSCTGYSLDEADTIMSWYAAVYQLANIVIRQDERIENLERKLEGDDETTDG